VNLRLAIVTAALALAACETDGGDNVNPPGTGAEARCRFDSQASDLNKLVEELDKRSQSADTQIEWVKGNEAKIRELAKAADNVVNRSALGAIACRRLSANAHNTLMTVPELREASRTDRKVVADKGQTACKDLSTRDRQEGSATACDLFDAFVFTHGAGVAMDRVLRTTSNAPVTVELLNQARVSAETFIQSVKTDWPKAPASGFFGTVARAEKKTTACGMSVRLSRLMQTNGPDGLTAAADDLGRRLSELEQAVAADLGVTREAFVRGCN
jgi:hypothetical protein